MHTEEQMPCVRYLETEEQAPWVRYLETEKQAPWVRYLEIDEETLESTLRDDAPDEIKKAYEQHQKKIQEYIDKGMLIPK